MNKLTVRSPCLPYMYGLVKTHKDGNPMRPIISSVGSISYKLSKFLVDILSPLLGKISGSHILNSCNLIDKLNGINISSNSRLVSFDVVSLFTKVPIPNLLDFLHGELENYNLPLCRSVIINLVRLCIVDCKFTFNNEFYMQCFGMAMGNPLSPLLSNIYMEFFERAHLPSFSSFQLHWFRYVDDCLCIVPDFVNVTDILDNLNTKVPSIKFTLEEENNKILPFLDVLIHREHSSLKYSIYRKPTNNLSYIHFYSGHDNKVKMSVFITMFLRCLRVVSPEYFDNEIEIIFDIGKKLGYSTSFIEGCFNKARSIFYKINSSNSTDKFNSPNKLILPYFSKFVNLPRLLKPLNIQVIFKYEHTLFKMIVKNSPDSNCNVIYRIPCSGCNKFYIGQTSKSFDTRIKQHQSCVKKFDNSNALYQHVINYDHRIAWDNANVLVRSKDWISRNILESFIISLSNNINISKGLFSFDPILIDLLRKEFSHLLRKL